MTTAPLILTLALALAPSNADASPASPGPNAGASASARGPAILDFHAEWCPPCKQMRPRVALLEENNYPVRSIDVDQHPELAERYRIEGVPTFVVVDDQGRELARKEGLIEARELADLYRDALGPTPVTNESRPEIRQASDRSAGSTRLPDPWATVVRIRVHDRGTLGFGSGTVIASNDEESIILTCAHIFSVKGRQPSARQFNLPVMVELFDGKLGGPGGQTVRPVGEPIPGEVIDYDFDRDVALVRIRPGRAVPSSRVVPPHWKAEERMGMYTVGCSHGEDATAWNTVIYAPSSRFRVPGKQSYDAIECLHSPKQGRSGGGLFTDNGYVAGVCNFAFDPSVGRGLYASPRSIYAILDRNNLSHLYQYRAPVYVADAGTPGRQARAPSDDVTFRGQTPPESDALADRSGRVLAVEPIEVPPPEFLGISLPEHSGAAPSQVDASVPRSEIGRADRPVRSGWKPIQPGGLAVEGNRQAGTSGRSVDRPVPAGSTQSAETARGAWSRIRGSGG
ncbi:thioredoxin domain-containing protein [Tautonia plasticadhaerens]|uniref:Thioredoxin-like protein n=1 Tax=Tautonia plasticadhaerens TaxID=2527974 RepID=A0A518H6K4_9BACT|nr:thioredoxin domain-containing protein [Tautonia plasticadhaerens]QDV36482.1 Thioredoxin-like protein [Tautonia plasticadhaerens]